jgi:hypothetical protein
MVAAGFSLRLRTVVSFSLRNLKVAATLPHFLNLPFLSSLTKVFPNYGLPHLDAATL